MIYFINEQIALDRWIKYYIRNLMRILNDGGHFPIIITQEIPKRKIPFECSIHN